MWTHANTQSSSLRRLRYKSHKPVEYQNRIHAIASTIVSLAAMEISKHSFEGEFDKVERKVVGLCSTLVFTKLKGLKTSRPLSGKPRELSSLQSCFNFKDLARMDATTITNLATPK